MKTTLAWLDAQGIIYEFIDYKKPDIASANLPDWAQRAGWDVLLNKRGMMWTRLSDDERADIDEAKALKLMAEYPTLIKRPVLDTGNSVLVGFDPERYTTELK